MLRIEYVEHGAVFLVVSNNQPLWTIGQHWHPTLQKLPRYSYTEFFSLGPTFWDHFLLSFLNLLLLFLLPLKCHWNFSPIFILSQNNSFPMFPTIFSLQMANDPNFIFLRPFLLRDTNHYEKISEQQAVYSTRKQGHYFVVTVGGVQFIKVLNH